MQIYVSYVCGGSHGQRALRDDAGGLAFEEIRKHKSGGEDWYDSTQT